MKNNQIALMGDNGEKICFSTISAEMEKIVENISFRCLTFIVCGNSIGAIMGYLAFVRKKIVPLLLDKRVDRKLLESLLNRYEPSFLWIPEESGSIDGYAEMLYEKYGYKLLKRNKISNISLYSELALLLTTSGSLCSSKLVRISYGALLDNARAIADYMKISCEQRPITTLPMNYTYGLSVINSHLISGASILVTDKTIMQQEFWDFFNREKATSIAVVPFFYEMLDKLGFMNMKIPSLEIMTQAGGKLSEDMQKKFGNLCQKRGYRFYIMYGQTEATARISYLPAEKCLAKIGSIGIPIPGGNISLIDEFGRVIQEADRVGEIVYAGKNVMLGYAEDTKDLSLGDQLKGKLYTGDLAKRDQEGYYYIVGRKKRIIKINGRRYNLDEVENFINDWAKRRICACVGVDDMLEIFLINDRLDEEVVILSENVFKIHRKRVTVQICAVLPETSTGKVCYFKLRNQLSADKTVECKDESRDEE